MTRRQEFARLSIAMLLGAGFAVGWFWWRAHPPKQPLQDLLVEHMDGHRFAEPRFFDFPHWAPCPFSQVESEMLCAGTQGSASVGLRSLAARADRGPLENQEAEVLRARGILDVMSAASGGDPELEGAIRQLQGAAGSEPGNSAVWNDLAAVLLLRARGSRRLESAAASLEASARSLEYETQNQAALFNQALALEAMRLVPSARQAWSRYLSAESDPAWTQEAEHRRAALKVSRLASRATLRTLVQNGPWQEVEESLSSAPVAGLNYALDELLPSLSRSEAAQRGELLGTVVRLGAFIQDSAGDRLLSEAASRLSTQGSVSCDEALALYGTARAQYLALDSQAGPSFERATRALADCGSRVVLWSRYYHAIELHRTALVGSAVEELRKLREEAADTPLLLAHVDWYLGLIHASGQRHDQALEHYERSLRIFERAGAVEESGYLHILAAEVQTYFGQSQAAWDHFEAALSTAETWPDPRRRRSLWSELASHLAQRNQPRAALLFADLTVEAALESERAWTIIGAFADRAELRAAQGIGAQASDDLVEARRWYSRLKPQEQERVEARLAMSEAVVSTTSSPISALSSLDRAVDLLRKRQVVADLPRALSIRARLLEQQGRTAEAEAGFEEALAALEAGGESAWYEATRSGLVARRRSVFDEAVRFSLDVLEDPDRAFAYAERGRRLEFLSGRGRTADSSAPRPGIVAAGLAPGTAALAYWVLPDRLIVWALSPSGVHVEQIEVASEELSGLVARAVKDPNRSQAPTSLAALVWSPIARWVKGAETLVIAADGPLHRLPLGLLTDSSSGRSILDRHEVIKVLGGVPALPATVTLPSKSRALLIGDPAFSPTLFPRLARLPAAARETQALARLFPKATVLVGADATSFRVVSELAGHEVIHVAAHSLVSEDDLDRSVLVLAEGDGEIESTLAAKTVEALDLSGTRLVVLSACGSARGGDALPPTVAGMARPFLAAGARVVVASHWPVGDEASAELLMRFHQSLRTTGWSASKALSQAQRALMQEPGPLNLPAAWAGFEVFVGRQDREHR